jgi:glucose/arabinose dehydrogenase
MAFHPKYAINGFCFVNYTDLSGAVTISRFSTSSADPDSAVAVSEQVLLVIPEPQANHNGGTILFGPSDGYLYIGVGDGGGSGDNHGTIGNGQDTTTRLGKILRIDVDHGSPYGIPPNNPFANISGADEIWALGLRNPWRMSFDRQTGDLYVADVGQNVWEEIDFQPVASPGGENYGWRLMEGKHCFNPSINCDPGGLVYPVTEYSHLAGCAVTGGYVYRGCQIPDLRGTYFYADYCSGRIWSFRYDGATLTDSMERTAELDPSGTSVISQPSSFGEDARGELYILDLADGEVYKIIPAVPVLSDCQMNGCCSRAGDGNNDGAVNVGDAVFGINYIFKGGPIPTCLSQADANGDCALNIGDAVTLVNYVFKDGPIPQCSPCL